MVQSHFSQLWYLAVMKQLSNYFECSSITNLNLGNPFSKSAQPLNLVHSNLYTIDPNIFIQPSEVYSNIHPSIHPFIYQVSMSHFFVVSRPKNTSLNWSVSLSIGQALLRRLIQVKPRTFLSAASICDTFDICDTWDLRISVQSPILLLFNLNLPHQNLKPIQPPQEWRT